MQLENGCGKCPCLTIKKTMIALSSDDAISGLIRPLWVDIDKSPLVTIEKHVTEEQ
jgi:hypothetical protein